MNMNEQLVQQLLLADRRDTLVENSMRFIRREVNAWYKPNRWFEADDVAMLAVEYLLTYVPTGTTAKDWWNWVKLLVQRAWSHVTKKLQRWSRELLAEDMLQKEK